MCWSLLLRRLRAAELERGRDSVDRSIIAFFSYESGNCVINSSVTFDQVLVSRALTRASLNVFNLKSEAKKSIDMNTSYLACILKPSAEHLLTNHSADTCQWTLEPLLGCICPEKIKVFYWIEISAWLLPSFSLWDPMLVTSCCLLTTGFEHSKLLELEETVATVSSVGCSLNLWVDAGVPGNVATT